MALPEIIQTEPMTVAYVTVHGSFDQIPQTYGLLYGWIAQHGLTPAGMPGTAYLTDPSTVPEDQNVYEVWAPFAGEAAKAEPDASGVGVKRVESMLVAKATHVGPYETVSQTYGPLVGWVAGQNHEISGPAMEFYYSDPATTKPEDYETEIWLPVRPK